MLLKLGGTIFAFCLVVVNCQENNTFPGSTTIPLFSENNYYYGEISLGTPTQTVKVLFDTTSRFLSVASSRCILCVFQNRYDSSKSSTYIDIGYDYDFRSSSFLNVEGFNSRDTLTLGDFKMPDMVFGETMGYSRILLGIPFDGVFGLNYETVDKFGPPSPFLVMRQQNMLTEPVFTFDFSRGASLLDGPGEITFGKIDHDRYKGDITYVPVADPNLWKIQMDSVEVADARFCSKGCLTTIDTSTAFIKGPRSDIRYINDEIGATYNFLTGRYEVLCSSVNTLPTINITLGDRTFQLNGEDYIVYNNIPVGWPFCSSGFMNLPGNVPDTWHLGTNFLRNFYTIFAWPEKQEAKRIGFANKYLESMNNI